MNQSYYRNVNPDLLDRIPLNAKAVVEVGCGTGALGGAYKLRNPQVHYIGVEAMSEPAAQASGVFVGVSLGVSKIAGASASRGAFSSLTSRFASC